ncbi:MAG: polymer-forming cytoskeletal protein [Candidatus Omnitrophota bacterium]|jgi:cytoskeletal protein CcmA (bactofilin family)
MAKKREEMDEKILDVDASMQGTIAFKDPVNLRINGSFEGKLETRGNLTIGENAKVKATINGDNIIVAGKVTGDIFALQGLSVIAPAVIQGHVTTPRLSVSEGAVIEGQISMMGVRNPSDSEDVMMTLRDVSSYLEVEARIVEEWASKSKIPARFEDGNWVFSKSSIDRWIQEENIRT